MKKIVNNKVIVSLIFCFLFLIYGLSVSRVNTNYADSNDLALAGRFLGMAHPSGFPLLVFILGALIRIFSQVKVFYLLNLFNAIMQALSGALLYLTMTKLGSKLKINKASIAAFLAVLFWAFRSMTWTHGNIIEVFPLAQVLMLTAILGFLHKKSRLGFFFGVSSVFLHQLTALLVIPVFIYEIRKQKNWSFLPWVILAIVANACLYLPFLANSSEYGWHLDNSVKGFYNFLLRKNLKTEGNVVEIYTNEINVSHSIKSVLLWAKYLLDDLYVMGVLLIILGAWYLIKNKKVGFLLLYLLVSVGFVMFMKYPLKEVALDEAFYFGTLLRLRMSFVENIYQALFIFLGIGQLSIWWKQLKLKYVGLFILLLLGLGWQVWHTYPVVMSNKTSYASSLSNEILKDLPENAVLISDSDLVFSILYTQMINKVRPDVIVVPATAAMLPRFSYAYEGSLYVLNYADRKEELEHIITYSLFKGKRVFLSFPEAKLLSFLGVEGNPLYLKPWGYVFEVSRDNKLDNNEFKYEFSEKLLQNKSKHRGFFTSGIFGQMGSLHGQLSYYFARVGNMTEAERHLNLSQGLLTLNRSKEVVNNSYAVGVDRFKNEGSYLNYTQVSVDEYITLAKKSLADGELDKMEYYVTRAMIVDPNHLPARELYVQYLRLTKNISRALEEIEAITYLRGAGSY